ncbi:unnamed protein product [Onchocerca flexuosa]|uniref:Uncharacterized protein n=1 Tax=Onchocerca flexuosa TaxID=387005 RepID=A0A3P8BPJ2_9BILA|nr:unnamed protein product [Onchocerca flexuosa]
MLIIYYRSLDFIFILDNYLIRIIDFQQFFESRPNYHQYSTISNDSGFNRNDQKFRVTSKMLAMKSKSNNNMACITKQLNMVIFY